MKKLLVANRAEIAVRIMHAAAELHIRTVALFSEDDARSLHVWRADEAQPLRGTGVAAYLDVEQIVAMARECGCDAVHPGYGFLSENAAFARRCAADGITFVGPRPETLEILGDKPRAREVAGRCGVPVLQGSAGPVTLEQARAFLASLGNGGAMVIKAVAGGGGRGVRVVRRLDEVVDAYARCRSEALQAFGDDALYAEQLMPHARHIEVQVVADCFGHVSHLGERECSIQRRHQKLVEIAPCPSVSPTLRAHLAADTVRMAEAVHFENAGTFEFLVAAEAMDSAERQAYAFIEANPRLQVEHTVTEEVLGLDLVRLQLQLAARSSLAELGLAQRDVPAPRGYALQVRINTEVMGTDGGARPASGTLAAFALPSGHGVRVDTAGYVGYETNPNFDPLLAKLIGHSTSSRFADTVARSARALGELQINGVHTNIPFLQRLLQHPEFIANRIDTDFVDTHISELIVPDDHPLTSSLVRRGNTPSSPLLTKEGAGGRSSGATVATPDPLAVLHYGKSASAEAASRR